VQKLITLYKHKIPKYYLRNGGTIAHVLRPCGSCKKQRYN